MSVRRTISVPEDVAEILDAQPNASAYVAGLVRRRTERERHDEAMHAVGIDPDKLGSPAAKAWVRDRLHLSVEQKAAGRDLARRIADGEDIL